MSTGMGLTGSQPLKWHGGKFYLAKQIIENFPPHVHYVEPFFGGGSVLFSKPEELIEKHSEVINDLNTELTNFWNVLREEELFQRLLRRVEATPFSEPLWEECCEATATDDVERAFLFFVRYRQSRQGIGKSFATMSRTRTRRSMNEQVSSWLSAIEGLPEVHHRLKRVVIFNDSAVKVIKREDGPSTFFYLDPPYVHETRSVKECYEHEMSVDDHRELLEAISAIEGKFLLSGYPSPLYEEYAERNKWHRIDIEIDNKASSLKSKPIKTECLWMNYTPSPTTPAPSSRKSSKTSPPTKATRELFE